MKIVINRCFGGFGLSEQAVRRMRELGSEEAKKIVLVGETYDDGTVNDGKYIWDSYYLRSSDDSSRAEWQLVQAVEELGAAANGRFSELEIVEIPDGVQWHIDEYDGMEHVAEDHRTWY